MRILRPDNPTDFAFLWLWELIIGFVSLWYLVNVPLEIGFEYNIMPGTMQGIPSTGRFFLLLLRTVDLNVSSPYSLSLAVNAPMGNHFSGLPFLILEIICVLLLCVDCFIQTIRAVDKSAASGHSDELVDDYDELWYDYMESREFQYVAIGLVPWRWILNGILGAGRMNCLFAYQLENFGNEKFCFPVDDLVRVLALLKLGRGEFGLGREERERERGEWTGQTPHTAAIDAVTRHRVRPANAPLSGSTDRPNRTKYQQSGFLNPFAESSTTSSSAPPFGRSSDLRSQSYTGGSSLRQCELLSQACLRFVCIFCLLSARTATSAPISLTP